MENTGCLASSDTKIPILQLESSLRLFGRNALLYFLNDLIYNLVKENTTYLVSINRIINNHSENPIIGMTDNSSTSSTNEHL